MRYIHAHASYNRFVRHHFGFVADFLSKFSSQNAQKAFTRIGHIHKDVLLAGRNHANATEYVPYSLF